MSMSLDGYITGVDDRLGQGLGREGGRLFNWLDDRDGPGINGQVYAEALATGALISGRRTFELAGGWGGDHHDGVPIHVLTHHVEDHDGPGRDDVLLRRHRVRGRRPGRRRRPRGDGARRERRPGAAARG